MVKLPITLRKLKEADISECIELFQDTVHNVNIKDYTPRQLEAWAPTIKLEASSRWHTLLENISYIAEYNHQVVGFGDMTQQGHLDRLFVHKNYQSQGIAAAIVRMLEMRASELMLQYITVEASITAKPFFEKSGYIIIKEQQVEIRGVKLSNFLMKKSL